MKDAKKCFQFKNQLKILVCNHDIITEFLSACDLHTYCVFYVLYLTTNILFKV